MTYKYKTIYKLLITQMYWLNNKIYAILICCVGQCTENLTIHIVLKHMLLLCDPSIYKIKVDLLQLEFKHLESLH